MFNILDIFSLMLRLVDRSVIVRFINFDALMIEILQVCISPKEF